jgi:hydrogenase maturation protease
MTALVVGLGHPDRGDDGVGRVVAAAVAALALPAVLVLELDDPAALLDLWTGAPLVVVVDAIRSGHPPGTVHVSDLLTTSLPHPSIGTSSHALGLTGTVELGRALGELPERLVLVGVEAETFAVGAPLSVPVRAAVEPAVAAVADLVRRTPDGSP